MTGDTKLCPMSTDSEGQWYVCSKERCAWWMATHNECALTALVYELEMTKGAVYRANG